MSTGSREKSPRWRELLSGLAFEDGDEGVFEAPNTLTRARRLRKYFFPKLNVMLNSGRSLISAIYGRTALDHFTEAQRPKPKNGAETEDVNTIHLGLVGVRVEDGLALRGSNGKPVQYGISQLRFEVFRRGTIAVALFPIIYGKDPQFYKRVSDALRKHEDFLGAVCGATCTSSAAYVALAPFSESLDPEHLRNCAFFSRGEDFPVGPDNGLERLVATFAALFPIQKLITDLSMGNKSSFEHDLAAFENWWVENGDGIFFPERIGLERADQEESASNRVRVLDSRVMITGAQRYRILDRDDYRCLACGRAGPDGAILHLDHIVPRSKGGTDNDDNLQTLCSDCNIGKSNRSSRDLRTRPNA